MSVAVSIVQLVLAGLFAVAGAAKLLDVAGTRQAVAGFGAPAPLVGPIAVALPLLELAIAGALFVPAAAQWAALAALALLLVFCLAIGRALARGSAPDCNCFGGLTQTEVGRGTLVRNLVLGALAGFAAFGAWGEDTGALSWIDHVAARDRVWTVVVVLLVAALAALGWFCWQVLRQNGRLLLRLDAQASELGGGGPVVDLPPLEAGDAAPDFAGTTLDGEAVTLSSLLAPGRPVAFVFADTHCSACEGALEAAAGAEDVAVVMRGNAAQARAKADAFGLARVVHDPNDAIFEAFRIRGAPGTLTVDPDGRVDAAVRMGADAARDALAAAGQPAAPLTTVQVGAR